MYEICYTVFTQVETEVLNDTTRVLFKEFLCSLTVVLTRSKIFFDF